MRTAIGITLSLLTSSLSAQWFGYPSAGIPRLPDGKPNLTAPVPRTADGKPDLSGIWGLACPVANAVNGTMSGANVYCATEVSVPAEFFDYGKSLKDGLPYQPWAAEVVKKTRAAGRPNDPLTRCFPPGMVRLETFPLFRKMIQIPGLLVILNEHNSAFRQIFTDARPLPVDKSPQEARGGSTRADLDPLLDHAFAALAAVGYLAAHDAPGQPERTRVHLRRMLAGAALSPEDVRALHGLCQQIIRAATGPREGN